MQIEYGDCVDMDNPELVAREAVKRFCPMKFTKGVLPHDLELVGAFFQLVIVKYYK